MLRFMSEAAGRRIDCTHRNAGHGSTPSICMKNWSDTRLLATVGKTPRQNRRAIMVLLSADQQSGVERLLLLAGRSQITVECFGRRRIAFSLEPIYIHYFLPLVPDSTLSARRRQCYGFQFLHWSMGVPCVPESHVMNGRYCQLSQMQS